MLAALGERDEEIAARDPQPLDAPQCAIIRRQALGVAARSLVTGIAVTVVMWMLINARVV